jgi:hypothetical protein
MPLNDRFFVALTALSMCLAVPVDALAQGAPAAQPFKPAEPANDGPAPAAPPQPQPPPAIAGPSSPNSQPVPQAISAETPSAITSAPPKTPFVLELHTDGFLGGLRDGLFLGGGGRRFTGGGAFSVSQTNFGGGRKGTSFALGPSFRWALASGMDDRVDLTFDLNASFFKAYVSDNQTFSEDDGYGFSAALGPGLRYWITKNLALTYSALLTGQLCLGRSRDVRYFSNWQQFTQFGEIAIGPRQEDVLFVYFTGRLALTGYF